MPRGLRHPRIMLQRAGRRAPILSAAITITKDTPSRPIACTRSIARFSAARARFSSACLRCSKSRSCLRKSPFDRRLDLLDENLFLLRLSWSITSCSQPATFSTKSKFDWRSSCTVGSEGGPYRCDLLPRRRHRLHPACMGNARCKRCCPRQCSVAGIAHGGGRFSLFLGCTTARRGFK